MNFKKIEIWSNINFINEKNKSKTKYKNGIRDTDIIFLVELKKRVHPNNAYQALKASTLSFYFNLFSFLQK